jgi:uncharacterized protein YecT (DUF1311 family)
MRIVRFGIALGGLLLALAAAPAQALDCRQASTSIEETICGDRTLLSLQQWLDEHYRATLKRSDQREHDLLIDRQRQWMRDVGAQCANLRQAMRQTCISTMIFERRSALPTVSVRAPASAKPFEGHWKSCWKMRDGEVCEHYTLFQQGTRVCGTWFYVATDAGYDGRLAWSIDGQGADWRYICGRPGSETSLPCPTDAAQSLWQTPTSAASQPQYICTDATGRYMVDLETSCRDKPTGPLRRWQALSGKQALQATTEGWLRACLDDPGYPDPSMVQKPGR